MKTAAFQESDRDKSKAQKAGMYKKADLDSPDDSVKRATPDLPRSQPQISLHQNILNKLHLIYQVLMKVQTKYQVIKVLVVLV